jgi:hypothetical protein
MGFWVGILHFELFGVGADGFENGDALCDCGVYELFLLAVTATEDP